jgi:hypothetical protein
MSAAPSFNDLVDLGRIEAKSRRPDLKFYDGDVTEAQLHACAAMGDAIIGWAAIQTRNLYFGGARGTDLDTIVMDKLGLARNPSTRALGTLTFSRGAGPTGNSGTIPAGTQIATAVDIDGARVVVTTDTDLAVSTGAFSSNVGATAVVYGTSGNVSTGLLTFPVDALLGGDNTISVTNAADFAGGNDSETDEAYSARARMLWQTQRRATLDAIEEGVLDVDTVAVAIAEEDEASGIVTLYVSDSSGNSNGRMLYDVELALQSWRAAGSVINVVGGLKAMVTITVSIDEYERGFDVAAAAQTIIDSAVTRINRLRVNQPLTMDSLTAAVIAPYATAITSVSFPSIAVTMRGVTTVLLPDTNVVAPGALIRPNTSGGGVGITVVDGKRVTGAT